MVLFLLATNDGCTSAHGSGPRRRCGVVLCGVVAPPLCARPSFPSISLIGVARVYRASPPTRELPAPCVRFLMALTPSHDTAGSIGRVFKPFMTDEELWGDVPSRPEPAPSVGNSTPGPAPCVFAPLSFLLSYVSCIFEFSLSSGKCSCEVAEAVARPVSSRRSIRFSAPLLLCSAFFIFHCEFSCGPWLRELSHATVFMKYETHSRAHFSRSGRNTIFSSKDYLSDDEESQEEASTNVLGRSRRSSSVHYDVELKGDVGRLPGPNQVMIFKEPERSVGSNAMMIGAGVGLVGALLFAASYFRRGGSSVSTSLGSSPPSTSPTTSSSFGRIGQSLCTGFVPA